jgi:protein arginine kinase
MTSLIEKALKAINQVGLSVKGFLGDGEASLGDMYQVSNDATLGMSERDIVENLGSIVMPLVQYERKAREELLQRRRVDLEDRVYRALGVLTHCRAIGSREAVELLSSLRLGASLGLVKGPSLAAITELIFRSQKYHVREVLGDFEEAEEARMLDYARARLIRAGLDGTILEAKDV